MFMRNMYFGIIILFQTGVGVPTNIFLLFLYSFNYFSRSRMKPLNLIFTQLNFINIMMFLKGGSEVAMHLGMENFLNDAGCKFVLFLHRLALALSVCFTCYLSIFQAITISSNVSRLGKFKVWVSHYIIHSCFFFRIFNLLLEMPVLFSVTGPRYMNNITFKLNFGYCSLESHNDVYWSLFAVRNVFSLVLIVCISCYIAHLLYRHHQKVETIQKSNLSARTSLEVRATQTILLLMSTFVFFYSLTSISIICMNYFYQERFWLLSVCSILSLCFLSFSPFILFPRGLRDEKEHQHLWSQGSKGSSHSSRVEKSAYGHLQGSRGPNLSSKAERNSGTFDCRRTEDLVKVIGPRGVPVTGVRQGPISS
ncbi:vomeronasal type-1 receptor 4-like [Petaurus breviceps papuanus]|uniref:vomeronasal type-1 receptor 4-like n=1 Tax=Petaurus breviceps papuanus TaxID=3040969 RepID=UPI0036DCA99F